MTRMIDRLVPEEVLQFLDNWRVWVGVAYFALAAVSVWLAVITMRTAQTASHTAREQAIRQSAIQSDYKACLRSIPGTARVNRFLGGVNDLANILVLNSQAALQAETPGDPLHQTRIDNLERLRRAQENVNRVRSFPVPTRQTCTARRDQALARG